MTQRPNKRQAILDAAIVEFQECGLYGANMDRIAERAPASKRTVYKYFRTKEELFQAVVSVTLDQISTLKKIHYHPERSLEDQLADFAQAKASIAENPTWLGLMRVALAAFIQDPDLLKTTLAKSEEGEDTLVSWLKAAQADGTLNIPNVELTAKMFWSMSAGVLLWPQVLHSPMDPTIREILKGELVRMFLRNHETHR
jgi:TetR/AcrR family transcriptional regulator of autoinduction and epiphytic fitness